MLFRSAASQPDSWISSCRPSRSRMASRVTASTSSAGSRPASASSAFALPRQRTRRCRRGSSPGIRSRAPAGPAWWRRTGIEPDERVRVGVRDGVDGGTWGVRAAVSVVTHETNRGSGYERLAEFSAHVGTSPGCASRRPDPGVGASRSCCRRTQCRTLGFRASAASAGRRGKARRRSAPRAPRPSVRP